MSRADLRFLEISLVLFLLLPHHNDFYPRHVAQFKAECLQIQFYRELRIFEPFIQLVENIYSQYSCTTYKIALETCRLHPTGEDNYQIKSYTSVEELLPFKV